MVRLILPRDRNRTKVGLDYGAILGAVERTAEASGYRADEHTSGPLPPRSPSGAKWLLWLGTRSDVGAGPSAGPGMDTNGDWWWVGLRPDGGFGFIKEWKGPGKISDGPSAASKIFLVAEDVTRNVVLPTLAVAAATISGPAGVAAVAFVAAVNKMAAGASLTSAVVSSTRDALPSLVATGVFDKALEAAKREGRAAAEKVRGEIVSAADLEAFEKARMIGTAVYAQRKSLEELKARIPGKAEIIDMAAGAQAAPLDIAAAFEGKPGVAMMNASLQKHAEGGSAGEGGSVLLPVVGGAAALALLWLLL